MISFPHGGDRPPDKFERPGSHEVARLRTHTSQQLEALDSPSDLIAEALSGQLQSYKGPLPRDHDVLRRFCVEQFRSSLAPKAVSAMLDSYVDQEQSTHIYDAIRRFLILIRSQAKPAMTCDAIAIAMGIHLTEARTINEIARAHKTTKQAMSKRAIRVCEKLGLKPSVLMRSESSRESYRIKQTQRHRAARDAAMGNGSIASLREKLAASRQHVTGETLRRTA